MLAVTLFVAVAAASTSVKTPCSSGSGSQTSATAPTYTTSPNFRLVASVKKNDLSPSIDDWTVSTYHLGACYEAAVMTPSDTDDEDYGRTFYANGTNSDIQDGKGDIVTDGATPPTPYGFTVPQLDQTDDDDRRAVQIICGEGTPGVAITRSSNSRPHLIYNDQAGNETFGGWYACNAALGPDNEVILYYRSSEEETPDGCADLILYPECVSNGSSVAPNAQAGPCYPNVPAINDDGSQ
ncbi:hypothetical protein LTR37_004488 [Vermiconidia calcicola]|uniref:Uncharacterized protein n=1 Tax=Vermiconidia calcicola TaxID=1690605 RepID=A0ACC3NNM7_9PEZI|nr:hypothetical protein LTR37_004488 [Vermiconidia calcicola]